MAATTTPQKGHKADKLMRDSLLLALHRAAINADGKPTRLLSMVAEKLVEVACAGDVPAIKEIFDRVDGKVAQRVEATGANGGPIQTQQIEDERADIGVVLAAVHAALETKVTKH